MSIARVARDERSTTIIELTPEFRHEVATSRVAALHRSAEPIPAGPVRRAVATWLVRLGLRLGYDGKVPPLDPRPIEEGTPATAGETSWRLPHAA
jgi:hypothetical protein